jgi:hypothetical protein
MRGASVVGGAVVPAVVGPYKGLAPVPAAAVASGQEDR